MAEETTCIRRDCWTIALEALLAVMMGLLKVLNQSSVASIVLCAFILILVFTVHIYNIVSCSFGEERNGEGLVAFFGSFSRDEHVAVEFLR